MIVRVKLAMKTLTRVFRGDGLLLPPGDLFRRDPLECSNDVLADAASVTQTQRATAAGVKGSHPLPPEALPR